MEKGSNGFLFDGWHDWSSYIVNAIVGVVKCISRVLYAIIIGIVTLLVYAYKQIKLCCNCHNEQNTDFLHSAYIELA